MTLRKRRKNTRYAGSQTNFRGHRKRTRGSGNRGGYGMAGTGKRGDQKKTLVINQFGNDYFGKSRTLRRGHIPKKLDVINLSDISQKFADKKEINLLGYKILGEGELTIKAKITASKASESAVEKIKKSGSDLILLLASKKEKTEPKKETASVSVKPAKNKKA